MPATTKKVAAAWKVDFAKCEVVSSGRWVVDLSLAQTRRWFCLVTHQDTLPDNVEFTTVPIATIAAERTFWEKVTILHAEAHRDGRTPGHYSRHYYDTAMMARNTALLERCQDNHSLLAAVREHKTKFYYAK